MFVFCCFFSNRVFCFNLSGFVCLFGFRGFGFPCFCAVFCLFPLTLHKSYSMPYDQTDESLPSYVWKLENA